MKLNWKKDFIFFDFYIYVRDDYSWELKFTNKHDVLVFISSNLVERGMTSFYRVDDDNVIIINKFGISIAIDPNYEHHI